jgi:hypothetical protein
MLLLMKVPVSPLCDPNPKTVLGDVCLTSSDELSSVCEWVENITARRS